jgi:lipoprotein-anchoring transpeptidase ErfK/SrfK
MKAPNTFERFALVALATLALLLSGTMAWATANDYGSRTTVPAGVSVNGTDLSGMSIAQARIAIEQAVSAPLMRPLTVTADGKAYTFDPRSSVNVDVEGMLNSALHPRRIAPFAARLRTDLGGDQMKVEVEPEFAVAPGALDAFIVELASGVNRPAVDASLTLHGSDLRVIAAQEGKQLDAAAARATIEQAFSAEEALAQGDRTTSVSVTTLAPKVTEKALGKTIVVDRSAKTLVLYNGGKVEKRYRCAVGTPGYPTPLGHWEIVNKRYRPTWSNPGSAWAKDMPAYIPPGPGNPLGTRALDLNASGIRIHGTNKDWSIGSAASHGCMRMHMWDIEDLYPRVPLGTRVWIIP